jgi:hypothetical protein
MSINSRGTPFWGIATDLISPGDIFPAIPFGAADFPIQIIRKGYTPKPGYSQPYNLFEHPSQTGSKGSKLSLQGGDDVVAVARISKALFLSWGSEVEEDIRNYEQSGRFGGRAWLAAPVFELSEIPDGEVHRHPEGTKEVSMRQIIAENLTDHCFFLPRLPKDPKNHLGRYADFRKMQAVRMAHFVESGQREATLMPDSYNDMLHQLFRFFSRADVFLHPIDCPHCGGTVTLDVNRFEGQNTTVQAWRDPEQEDDGA